MAQKEESAIFNPPPLPVTPQSPARWRVLSQWYVLNMEIQQRQKQRTWKFVSVMTAHMLLQ